MITCIIIIIMTIIIIITKYVTMQDTWRNAKYSMQMFVSMSEAMQRCWNATDALFDSISEWGVQPIDVRHPFGFYYGHLASFAKLKTMPTVRTLHKNILQGSCACSWDLSGSRVSCGCKGYGVEIGV